MARPEKLIVTSNWEIRDIWTDERTYLPLERRFKVIRYNDNGPIQGLELPRREQLDNSHLRPREEPILVEDDNQCLMCYLDPCICPSTPDGMIAEESTIYSSPFGSIEVKKL